MRWHDAQSPPQALPIVSGINMGPNTATNIMYSGTVSAAAEAVIMGVPGLALSLTSFDTPEFEYSCSLAQQLVKKIVEAYEKNGGENK